jgi:hypothetical protein
MTKDQIRDAIRQHGIPRATVARLCGMYSPDLSGWLNNRIDLNPLKIERIKEVVAATVEIIEAGRESGIEFNLRDPENVRRLLSKASTFKSTATKGAESRMLDDLQAAEDIANLQFQ